MCQPKSTGGRRCAAHTRPKFQVALAALRDAQDLPQRRAAHVNCMEPGAFHAATKTGRREIQQLRDEAAEAGDLLMRNFLDTCLRMGSAIRQIEKDVNQEVARRIGT